MMNEATDRKCVAFLFWIKISWDAHISVQLKLDVAGGLISLILNTQKHMKRREKKKYLFI